MKAAGGQSEGCRNRQFPAVVKYNTLMLWSNLCRGKRGAFSGADWNSYRLPIKLLDATDFALVDELRAANVAVVCSMKHRY